MIFILSSLLPHLISSHLSADPARVDGCHQYVVYLEVLGLTTSQHVQRRLLTNSREDRTFAVFKFSNFKMTVNILSFSIIHTILLVSEVIHKHLN